MIFNANKKKLEPAGLYVGTATVKGGKIIFDKYSDIEHKCVCGFGVAGKGRRHTMAVQYDKNYAEEK